MQNAKVKMLNDEVSRLCRFFAGTAEADANYRVPSEIEK
jgi:hypothetical protein